MTKTRVISGAKTVIVKHSGGSIGVLGVLFIILFLLKVGIVKTQVMGWSWWWIFGPLWIPTVAILGIVVGLVVLVLIIAILAAIFGK